jgi:UDP-GlcNAc3NAcA epimerase
MLKIATIVGARPQFIKAASVSNTIREKFADQIQEIIIHSGQHYDFNMSEVFFSQLNVPKPDYFLNVGSNSHAIQTAEMIIAIEKVLVETKPNMVLVYGDTNTTLAGALTASKLNIPVVHIEAGLRSFNKKEPEEQNRILTDHLSTYLFCPTEQSMKNLKNESFILNSSNLPSINSPQVLKVGDVMYDLFLKFKSKLNEHPKTVYFQNQQFILATIHRAGNVQEKNNLEGILRSIVSLANDGNNVLIPLHPGTLKRVKDYVDHDLRNALLNHPKILVCEPLSYLDLVHALDSSFLVMTDSGGLQKEAYFSRKPCVVIRNETEWVELIENNFAIIGGNEENEILIAVEKAKSISIPQWSNLYGNGDACEKICKTLLKPVSN